MAEANTNVIAKHVSEDVINFLHIALDATEILQ